MFKNWVSLEKNIGTKGYAGSVIKLDEELLNLARITIVLKQSASSPGDHYEITIGVYGVLVHTIFFTQWEDAIECTNAIKLIVQTLLNIYD